MKIIRFKILTKLIMSKIMADAKVSGVLGTTSLGGRERITRHKI